MGKFLVAIVWPRSLGHSLSLSIRLLAPLFPIKITKEKRKAEAAILVIRVCSVYASFFFSLPSSQSINHPTAQFSSD